jgi:stage II sporulation protein D
MKSFAVVIWCLFSVSVFGQLEIRVRLWSDPGRVGVSVKEGHYYLLAAKPGGEVIDTIWDIDMDDPARLFYVQNKGEEIEVSMNGLGKLKFAEIWMVPHPDNPDPSFIISGAGGKERWYQDKLHFYTIKEGGKTEFTVVNQVNIEKYVAGVVESEGGAFAQLEYFKAQAVLARTFALKNLKKHIHQRYNLRDDVSSQVYHSRAYLQNAEMINIATRLTADTVITDKQGELLLALFHANSGGQTANAGDVWSKDISYLQSKPDPFSVGQNSYAWSKKLPRHEVLRYFADELGVTLKDTVLQKKIATFTQKERKAYFEYGGKSLKLTRVRARFNLRSTFFSVEESGDFYVFKGKGYGHGVGLSQDGAINMSSSGFGFKDILYFYYEKSELNNLTNILRENEAVRQMVIQNALWVDPGDTLLESP